MNTPTATATTPDTQAIRRRRLVRGLIVAGIVLVAVNLVIIGISQTSTGTKSQTNVLPSAIQSISPVPGSTVRPQDAIQVDLRDGLVGDLYIDGRVIPVDQTEQIAALGLLSFRPAKGKEFDQFGPGRHTVEVRWRDQRATPDTVDGSYSWEFGVA
jgi:hypothetical protein